VTRNGRWLHKALQIDKNYFTFYQFFHTISRSQGLVEDLHKRQLPASMEVRLTGRIDLGFKTFSLGSPTTTTVLLLILCRLLCDHGESAKVLHSLFSPRNTLLEDFPHDITLVATHLVEHFLDQFRARNGGAIKEKRQMLWSHDAVVRSYIDETVLGKCQGQFSGPAVQKVLAL